MNVQIFKRRSPALVQHLQHVGQFVALAGMVLSRMVTRVVHLVGSRHRRMVRVMGMVLRMTGVVPVVLLTVRTVTMLQGRVMVLHVLSMFRRDVLLGDVGWCRTGRTIATTATACTTGTTTAGLHRFRCRRMVRLPTAPDACKWDEKQWLVKVS